MAYHSIYGRMFGYDPATGAIKVHDPVNDALLDTNIAGWSENTTFTTTTDTLKDYGLNLIAAASAATYTLPTPSGSGRRVRIVANSASTQQTVTISSGNGSITSTAGSSMFNILFTAAGAGVELQDISTIWLVINHHGSSAAVISS
jgi:hypothetical protein